MLKEFQAELKKLNLKPEAKLLLAISGGVDSMVVWSLFRKTDFRLAVAHLNFSLREKESDADEAFVKSEAAKYTCPFFLKKVETTTYAKKKKISIQMAARELRYDWFDQLLKENGFDYLVTAHHLDDSIETFFINLNRGTGVKGLTGIHSTEKIIRPLLNLSKEAIRTYAETEKISFREDQSNAAVKYERNWFRHEIISPWKDRNPDFLKSMQTTMNHLNSINDFVDFQLKKESTELEKQLSQGFLSIASIQQLSHTELVLQFLLEPLGFNFSTVSQIIQSINNKSIGSTFKSKNTKITLDREKLFIQEEKSVSEKNAAILIESGTKSLLKPLGLKITEIEASQFQFKASKTQEGFDADKIKFPLELRKWKAGDWMIPLGMKGKKKISDVLIDEKIPLHKKEEIYVLLSENQVVWVLGIRMDERFKIDSKTKKMIKIQWLKKN